MSSNAASPDLGDRQVRDDLLECPAIRREVGKPVDHRLGQAGERRGRLGREVDDGREPLDPREAHVERPRAWPRWPPESGGRRASAVGRQEREDDRDVGRDADARRPVPAGAQAREGRRERDADDDGAGGSVESTTDGVRCARCRPRPPVSRLPDHVRRIGQVHHVALIVPLDRGRRSGCGATALGLELETVMDIAGRPRPDRVPRGRGVEDRARRADRRHDRRRALPRRTRARASTTSASRSRTSPRRSCGSRSTASSCIDSAPRRGAEGPVAFLHPRSCHGVLVELDRGAGRTGLGVAGLLDRTGRALRRAQSPGEPVAKPGSGPDGGKAGPSAGSRRTGPPRPNVPLESHHQVQWSTRPRRVRLASTSGSRSTATVPDDHGRSGNRA